LVDALEQLVSHARLADTRGRSKEHHARIAVLDALVEHAAQQRELSLSTDARRRLAEERTRRVDHAAFAGEHQTHRVARDVEARTEQGRGDVVDANRSRRAWIFVDGAFAFEPEQLHRAIDRPADG